MLHETLAFGAGALGVAMIVLLVAGSYWVQLRLRAGLLKRPAVAVMEKANADSMPNAKEATGGGVAGRPRTVVAGVPGSSDEFRRPARGTVLKDVMNRALTIHYFGMMKRTGAPAQAK